MQLSTLSSGDLTPGHALPVPFDGMAMQAAACEPDSYQLVRSSEPVDVGERVVQVVRDGVLCGE
jgi:hypothetical protein